MQKGKWLSEETLQSLRKEEKKQSRKAKMHPSEGRVPKNITVR